MFGQNHMLTFRLVSEILPRLTWTISAIKTQVYNTPPSKASCSLFVARPCLKLLHSTPSHLPSMRSSLTFLLASAGLGLASPFASQGLPSTLESNLPHSLAEIELEQFENWTPDHLEDDNNLQARKHVKICTASSARAGKLS